MPAGTPTRRGARGLRWSLSARLVATLALTVTLVCVAIATISLVALRGSLVSQLQTELRSLSTRVLALSASPAGQPSLDAAFQGPGAVPGTIAVVVQGGSYTAGYLDSDYQLVDLGEDSLLAIVDGYGGEQFWSRDLGNGLGAYEFAAAQSPLGSAVIVGLPLAEVNGTVSRLALTIGLVALAGILVIGALATVYIRHSLRPLERVAQTADRIAAMPLDRGEVDLGERVDAAGAAPGSEIGRVVTAFNEMMGRVGGAFRSREQSEAKVRRFVADASHELRTPLASIRGYSELTRRMAADLPDDAVYALGRIESESVRMTTLVEDLLLLARLDEGRELATDPVDLGDLVADAVNDARAAGPEHRWAYAAPVEPVFVRGDAPRLQQVVVNLLANARVHTPAGTSVTVEVGPTPDEERVRVSVTDDGPGIPAEAVPALFERFARADASRARTTGSTGLGLAIVEAVVHAHRGTVRVESRPGRTRFVVELPALAGPVPSIPSAS